MARCSRGTGAGARWYLSSRRGEQAWLHSWENHCDASKDVLRIKALPLTGRSIMAIIRYWSRWHKMAKQPKLHQFCGHPIIPISSLFWFPNHAWENKSCVSEIETRDRYLAARQLRPPPPPEGGVLVQMDVTFTNMFSTDFLSVFTCMLCTN